MALTDLTIKKAKPRDTPYKLGDAGGMFLWVTPSGGKSWRWSYRHDGKQKLMALGLYPDVPLSLARERHAQGANCWHRAPIRWQNVKRLRQPNALQMRAHSR